MLSGACVSAMLLRLSLCSSLNMFVWFVCEICCVLRVCVLFVYVCVWLY